MQTQIHTIAFRSIETIAAIVQIHIAIGLPAMVIVNYRPASPDRLGKSYYWPSGFASAKTKNGICQKNMPDFADLKGQDTVRHVLEIAAGGGHYLLMAGSSGAGKSIPDLRLASLLPTLSPVEALEVTMLLSVAGNLTEGGFIQNRLFCELHHLAPMAALHARRQVEFPW